MPRNIGWSAMLLTAWPVCASPVPGATPLVELLEHRSVVVMPAGTGGHVGESVRVTVRNRGTGPVLTSIPVGWVFVSERPEVQDLLVVREEVLSLAGGASRTVTCRAFCCEASGPGPEEGEAYRAGHPGSEKLMAVARHIAAGDYPDPEAQHAVWVLSDGHDIASMGGMDSSATDTLRLAVARLSGQPPPRHTLRYVDEPGRACSGRPASVHRRLVYDTVVGTVLTVVVVDRLGRVVRVLHDRDELGPGRHALTLDVAVLDWPPGSYAIHAFSPDRAGVHRMPFTL